jgi:hypothetical protein
MSDPPMIASEVARRSNEAANSTTPLPYGPSMAHHRFDPIAAYERLSAFDPASAQRADRRAHQRDAQRLRRFIETTSGRLRDELDLWIRIACACDAGEEPTEEATVDRLTDLPGVSDYFALAERIRQHASPEDIRADDAA